MLRVIDRILLALVCLSFASALVSCGKVFACNDASQCRLDGAVGMCEPDGFCSFPDSGCASGRRYGEFVPDRIAGDCVVEDADDASSTTEPVDTDAASTSSIEESGSSGEDTGAPERSSGGEVTYECEDEFPCTMFVSPVGDDGGDGSMGAPFETIMRAVQDAGPGAVICVREGDYEEHVIIDRSGAPGLPIVLRSHPGETAHLRTGMKIMAGWGVAIGHIVLHELDVTQNGPTSPEFGDQCIYLHSAHDVVIRRSYIHDCNGSGINAGFARDLVIESNQISRCAVDVVDVSTEAAVRVVGPGHIVQNNLIDRNAGYGVMLVAEPWDPVMDPNHPADESFTGSANCVVTNNVLAFNQNRAGVAVYSDGAVDNRIQNNIFVGNAEDGPQSAGANGVSFLYSGTGHVVRNNLYFGAAPPVDDTAMGASYQEWDALEADPMFVDPSGTTFRLLPGSPAIDAGISDAAPELDIECTPRPQGSAIDLGPYEVIP